jgi:choline dehydrogenase-like flavoprotein
VARSLSLEKRRVLVLEAGSDARVDYSFASQLRATRTSFVGQGIPVIRGFTLGGTSMLYYATAFDPPLEMFRSHGVDLSAEVEEVRRELPICQLPDRAIGPRAKRIMASARDLGYAWEKLDKFVYAERCETGVPHEARWNARIPLREGVENGAVVKTGARVRRVIFERDRAVGVEFNEGGSAKTARAGTIVLSAGGIGSAVILAASGISTAGNGFFCDPLVIVNGVVDDISGKTEAAMSTGVHLPHDGYMLTDLTQLWFIYGAFTALALRFDRILAHPGTLSIMVKAKDELGGRITADGRVRRTFSREDIGKLEHGAARAETILKKSGAKHVFRYGITAVHPGARRAWATSSMPTSRPPTTTCTCAIVRSSPRRGACPRPSRCSRSAGGWPSTCWAVRPSKSRSERCGELHPGCELTTRS